MSRAAAHAWLVHRRAALALGALQRLAPTEPFLVVKSVALAARYGWDPAEMPIADVDVRMPREAYLRLRDRVRGTDLLRLDGWAYGFLVLELEGQLVDVESTFGAPFLTRLRVDDLMRRAVLAELPGAEPFLVPETTDHALVLTLNVFKDGLARPSLNAHRNAMRIVDEPDFDVDAFVRRARWSSLHTVASLVAHDLAPRSPRWREIQEALGLPSRALYMRLHEATRAAPDSMAARVLRRWAPDAPWRRLAATCSATVFVTARALAR